MSNNLLITGINGFVGTNLYNNLKDSFNIYGIDVCEDQSKHNCTFYSWDDFDSIPSADVIIHLAGKAHDTSNTADESQYFEINVGLTKNIFEHFLNSSARKFIFFSSVKAVADDVTQNSLIEDVAPNPATPYGKSKLEAENYLLSRTLPPNKQIYIFRPAMIHGPGNKGNLNLLYSFVENSIPYPLGAFKNFRSYASIDNLLYIITRVIEEEIQPGTYNICDDDPLSTTEVVSIIYDTLEKKRRILSIPKQIIQAIAHVGDYLHIPINSERLKKMTESYVISNVKIKNALGIKTLPVSAHSGMVVTIKSFLDN